ncbi:MAG: nucleotidyltransferase domain-containing protein [bacterium]
MAYTKAEAVAIIRNFLKNIRSAVPIERAYLFGSYATGRNRDYSDIDLAIVTSAVNTKNSLAINQDIFHRAMLYNVDLEPICFSPEEFEQEYLPIVRDIKREGVEITPQDKAKSLAPIRSRRLARASKSLKASKSRSRSGRVRV